MPSIQKESLCTQHVLVDTNTLWHEDKSHVVAPSFESFWSAYGSKFNLKLLLPHVVKGELLYQHTRPALAELKKANEAIEKVSGITAKEYSHRVTDKRVRREVQTRLDRWLSSVGGEVVATPSAKIDWNNVVESAIWRKAPFTADKDKNREKGFRDAMILETVVDYCESFSGDAEIVFLSKDELLRTCATDRLKADPRFTAYELISDFTSFLDLTQEELEEAFIRQIVKRAGEKFFTKGNPNCLYYRDSIRDRLHSSYQEYFDSPEDSEEKSTLLAGLLGKTEKNWTPKTPGMYWVSRPVFVSREDPNIYNWSTTVTFVQPYVNQTPAPTPLQSALLAGAYENERELVLEFKIEWYSKVSSNGRFREYEMVKHELTKNSFRRLSGEERKYWNLEASES